MKRKLNLSFALFMLLGIAIKAAPVCPITKTNGGGFTTKIETVVMNCNGTYTIQLLLVHDGCPGPVCKELSDLAIEAIAGTYTAVSKTIVTGSMSGGTLTLGPNIGRTFQGFKFDNTSNIGDGKAGSVRVTYTLTSLQNQQVSAKAGTALQIAAFTIADFQSVATCNGTNTPLPYVASIQGASSLCRGTTTTLTDSTTGGTWSSSNTAIATVTSSGLVTGVAAGTDTIRYAKTNSCGTTTIRKVITVVVAPVVSSISGASYFCIGTTTTLTNTTAGGIWSSNNTAIATVNSSGVVTGVASGGVTISYAVTNACSTVTVTKGLTVNGLPTVGAIAGSHSVSAARTITLTDTTIGGTWSSSNAAVATVNASGVVTGVAGGTAIISYGVANTCGTTTVTYSVTVTNLPPQAINDTVSTLHNTPVNINAMLNDNAGSGALVGSTLALTGTLPSTTSVGTFVNNHNGTVTFTPVSSYTGTFSVSYQVSDALNQTTSALIIINVAGVVIVDNDHDGVPDALDEYPTDPYRAFNNRYPSTGFSTLMYEDLWPFKGDYDFNDLVIDYKYNRITNAQNNVVEVKYSFVARCAGAGLHNGFAFQLDNVAPGKITSVTGAKTHNASWVALSTNGTESSQTFANVIVFDNVYNVLTYPGSGHFLNTDMDAPKIAYDTTSITMVFINNGVAPTGGTLSLSSLPATAFNPYLVLGDSGSFNQNRSKELHLADRLPSSKMSTQWFGTGDDKSNPAQAKYFKTINNLPWAIEISNSIPYMREYIDISEGYSNFINWATSNGTTHTDWYLDLTGYRNVSKLYTK